MVHKRVLVPERVRRPPAEGFSWVDRRFVRDHAESLSRDAILLYLFLAAVSDRDGLSFWSDEKTSVRLKVDVADVERAREELVRRSLLAYAAPLSQILAMPALRVRAQESRGDEPTLLADILRQLKRGQP